MEIRKVKPEEFFAILLMKQVFVDRIRESTSPVEELLDNPLYPTLNYYLSDDNQSGFVIDPLDGELTSLFSDVKGRGKQLIESALKNGALKLDCFDGYLVNLYNSMGFMEYKRCSNWNQGGPDVVYMAI